MKEVAYEQKTEMWMRWRNAHIGSSDASLIAAFFIPGFDWPYGHWAGAELYKLWATKSGRMLLKINEPSFIGDPRFQGNKNEPIAREWYQNETGDFAVPMCVESDEVPHLAASLDGWTGEKPVEIKCPTEPGQHRDAKEGKLPDQYYAQFQHILFVTKAPALDYVSFYDGEGVICRVDPDEGFTAQLRAAEEVFWKWVKDKKFPLPLGELDIKRDEEEQYDSLRILVESYLQNVEMSREIEARERALRMDLMRLLPAARVKGFGASITLRVRPQSQVPAFTKSEGLEMSIRRV